MQTSPKRCEVGSVLIRCVHMKGGGEGRGERARQGGIEGGGRETETDGVRRTQVERQTQTQRQTLRQREGERQRNRQTLRLRAQEVVLTAAVLWLVLSIYSLVISIYFLFFQPSLLSSLSNSRILSHVHMRTLAHLFASFLLSPRDFPTLTCSHATHMPLVLDVAQLFDRQLSCCM